MRTLPALALGAVLLASPGRAAAAVPFPGPGPVLAGFAGNLAFNVLDPRPIEVTTFGLHELRGPGGWLRLDSALFPSPFMLAAVPDIRDNFYGRVVGTLHYEVVVVGRDTTVPVFVHAAAELFGSASNNPLSGAAFTVKAGWSIDGPSVFFSDELVVLPRDDVYFDSFDHIVPLSLVTNRPYRVRMIADVAIANGTTGGGRGQAYAYIDPVFSFGPGVGPEYSFVFSPGVGNARVSAVPEPGTLALLAAGLLGLAARRRRR